MDAELLSIVNGGRSGRRTIRFVDSAAGRIELSEGDDSAGAVPYTLKPLAELYGPGSGRETLDPTDELFLPLLMAIEETFVDLDADRPITDGQVSLALDRLGQSPETSVPGDPVVGSVQLSLRLALSIVDYSRQDVRKAIRTIAKSVARHTKASGPRGYLTFIHKQLRR